MLLFTLLSHVQLFATPWTVALAGSSVLGILLARTLEWVAVFFFRVSSRPRDRTQLSRTADKILNGFHPPETV